MYFYLYDGFLQDKKYSKLLGEIEARLIDLSIQGKTARLHMLHNMKEMISDEIKRGAGTVVVLGDDKTVTKAINAIADLNITLGIIPIGENNILADYLGIPFGLLACDVLSKRVKEKIDVAKVNSNYFAFYLKALSPYIKIVSQNGEYAISPIKNNVEIYICNFKPKELAEEALNQPSFFVPQDGRLEAVIKGISNTSLLEKILFKNSENIGDCTILPFTTIRLEASVADQDVRLMLDGDKIIKPPVTIMVLPNKVSVIVGKSRGF
jgi:diacylglycerol kinase family enzyme